MVTDYCKLMGAIGGYFELELRQGEHYHKNALRLNTARNCFEYILLARKYNKVYIPYYTCEVLLQPLQKYHIQYEFYSINKEMEPIGIKSLLSNEAFLYTNYYGLKQDCVVKLASYLGNQLIVDNAQAFFAPRITSIDTFYSPRKFFGVPDGGYLYTDCVLNQELTQDKSYDRMQHLLQRVDASAEYGYCSFRQNDASLNGNPIREMSKLTLLLLCNIDYGYIKKRRRANYSFLHKKLKNSNLLHVDLLPDEVPMVYPYYSSDKALKKRLIDNKIYVATYWPNVLDWCEKGAWEQKLVDQCLALPIDQRYDANDMKKIIDHIII